MEDFYGSLNRLTVQVCQLKTYKPTNLYNLALVRLQIFSLIEIICALVFSNFVK